MSDYRNPYAQRRSPYAPKQSAYEQEMAPFVSVAKEERSKEQSRLNPLQFVLNILQTPNYISANVVDAVLDGFRDKKDFNEVMGDALGSAWKALTWQDKRTFKDVILGNVKNREAWEKPLLGEWAKDKPILGASGAGILGLLGDVILDPSTYVSFGASTGAKAAGKKFAIDSAKAAIAKKSAGELAEIAGKGVARETIEKIATKSKNVADDLTKYLTKHGGDSFSRYMDDLVRKAEKQAAFATPEVLQKQLTEQVSGISGIDDLMKSIERGYKGAGESAYRILGQEVGKKVRDRKISRTWNYMKDAIGETKAGQKLSDAWWAVMNKGPVGLLRKTFGIKNPYQKMLDLQQRDATALFEKAVFDLSGRAQNALKDFNEETMKEAFEVRILAEHLGKKSIAEGKDILTVKEILQNRELYTQLKDIPDKQVEKIIDFWDDMDKVFTHMRDVEKELVEKGVIKDFGEIINYIPKYSPGSTMIRPGKEIGKQAPGFTKATTFSTEESVQQGIAQLKMLYGDSIEFAAKKVGQNVDEFARDLVMKKNLAPISTNLPDMIEHRIMAHGRAIQRGKLIDQFKPFGIRVDGLDLEDSNAAASLLRAGGDLQQMGLVTVKDPAFQGMLFDKDVAAIIERAYQISNSDESIKGFQQLFNMYTSWWKSAVTATPGFHARNFISNNMTGFLRHGFKWFDMNKMVDSTVAVHYALNPNNYIDILTKEFTIPEGRIRTILNKRYGDFTLQELADFAREKGVISTFSAQGQLKKVITPERAFGQKINIASRDNIIFDTSKKVGSYIESASKFQSFLHTYDNITQSFTEDLTTKALKERMDADEIALEFASQDTKRWFIDYGNLSEAEKKISKMVPFYTWLRKNLSNQLTGMVMMRDMYTLIPKATKAITQDEGFDYDLQPEWQKNLGMVPVGRDEETGEWMMFFPNFPYVDINKIPVSFGKDGVRFEWGQVRDEILSSAHPTVKSIVEVMYNKNSFKRRDMLDRVKAPGLVQFFSKAPGMIGVLDGFARAMGFEHGIRIRDRDGKVEMDERMERLLSANLPVLRTLEKWIDLGTDLPFIEDAIESAIGKKDDYEGLEDFFQSLSYFGGIKLKTFDEEYYKQKRAEELEERAEELRKEYRKSLPGYSKRSAQYWKGRDARRRRLGLYG